MKAASDITTSRTAHLAQFNGAARFSTWLTRIAVNESLVRLRRRGRYETFDDDLSNVEAFMWRNVPENPERQAFSGELRGLLECALDATESSRASLRELPATVRDGT